MLRGAHADAAEVFASLVKTRAVRAAAVFRVLELNLVILPPADFAYQPRTRRLFIQRRVAATGAWIAVHTVIVDHRKEIFCDLTSSTGAE